MGNECCSVKLNKLYEKQFGELNFNEFKCQWSAINAYKIKKIFSRLATLKEGTRINIDNFCEIFPEFIRYEETQKKRIYEIFDRSNCGQLQWNDFYDSISLCYFAQERVLAVLMFMIFDDLLEKQIDEKQLTLLVDLNAAYLKSSFVDESQAQVEPEVVIETLLLGQKSISLEDWLMRAPNFFDFNQFRRLFNIFKQEKLQKQLVQRFNEWNQLYDQNQDKYIGYIINFKWFEAWKIYVENEYGISFNIEDKNMLTSKSIKTKKSLRTNNSGKNKRHYEPYHTMRKIKFQNSIVSNKSQQINVKTKIMEPQVKNFDMIRSIIGERPKQIYNRFLQGQYAGTFKIGLVQNRDYVFVSEKVWDYITEIYSGEPEFRRTGFQQIDLYPRIIRIYTGLKKEQIDYSSETVRQVNSNRTIEDLMTKSLQIQSNNLSIFYRTIGMPMWQQISNKSDTLIELTPSAIILMFYTQRNSSSQKYFRSKYARPTKTIEQTKLGDILIYSDSNNKIQKQVVFFNRKSDGKYIIHFLGESYVNDLCLNEKQFFKYCKLNTSQSNQKNAKSCKIEKNRRGIQGIKNLSFFNSFILQFLEQTKLKELKESVQKNQFYQDKEKIKNYLSIILAYIDRQIKSNTRVDPQHISFIVDTMFPNFRHFDITCINSFIQSFSDRLKQQAEALNIYDIIRNDQQFSIKQKIICPKCGMLSQRTDENQQVLSVPIPETVENYYQVIYVPFCLTMSNTLIKRYGFQLNKNATLRDYKNKLIEIGNLQNKSFILLQIECNTIIKNYNHVKDENKTLESIYLREDDNIFAFQLYVNFSSFVRNHFSFNQDDNSEIEQKDIKIGDMIDCKSPEKGWVFGKVVDKQIMAYTYQENLKVLHKFNNNDQNQYSYKVQKNVVAFFPSNSHKNCEQYHLKLTQRVFSEANNQMINCNLPLVIVLPSWIRPKQFQYLVYLQIQKFIAPNYIFQDENSVNNFIGSTAISKNIMRQTTKMKVKKFKQYLYGKNLPYKLNYIDNSGHCLICYKLVKSCIYKDEEQNYCEGCTLSNDEPISWQIMLTDLSIAVDWKNSWSYRKDVIRNDSTYINSSTKKKKDVQTIQSCLDQTLHCSFEFTETLCCNIPVKALITRQFCDLPNYLILSLQRITQENGFKRKIRRPVYFGDENIRVQGQEYKLVGVIASKGSKSPIVYTTYIKDNQKGRWLAYNGQRVQIIRKEEIDKKCTLLFFYQKINMSKDRKIQKMNQNIVTKVQKKEKEQQIYMQEQKQVEQQSQENEQYIHKKEQEVPNENQFQRQSENEILFQHEPPQKYQLDIKLLQIPDDQLSQLSI